jgi:ATP-dependent exoDNAse (exonuclease V) alpha subunit
MSQRRDEAIRIFVAEFGRRPTHNEETMLLRRVRPDKDNSLTPEEVHDIQMSRCSPDELAMVSEAWRNSYHYVRPQREPGVEESVRYALNHIFERVSVAQDFEILEEALRHNRGRATLDQIKANIRELEKTGRIFSNDGEIATEESLSREKAMIGLVDQGRGMYEPLHRYRDFAVNERLTDQQRDAVEYILSSRDLAINLRGAPGTGKTFTLQEIKRGLEQAERPIVAIAPTKSAEEELRRVGFEHSMTIEGLLQDKDVQSRVFNSVIIIDEAGMVGAESMFQLLSLAARCGSRVIFSGDTHQIQPVVAGDALRVLEKESTLGSAELTEPQRQKNEQYSQAVKTLRDNPDLGFEMLEAQGAVKEVSDLERPRAVAKACRELLEKDPNGKMIVVAPTHAEIASVTEAIRAARHAHHELGEDHKLTRLEPLNWTLAEKSDMRNYSPGQMLVFHRPTKDADRHEVFEILSVRDNAVLARNQDGTEAEFTQKQAKSFGVFAARDIEVAPGDRLMLQQNRRNPDFRATNGEFVDVKAIDADGRIELQDGRILPENYLSFTHGYATTSHKSQGKTVRNVLISGNFMSRELFYVSASRGEESVQIFTANAEALRDSIGVSGARQSATELAARAMEAGLETARHQMWWTDYETGAPTIDPNRAQPGATQGQPSRVQQERHHDRANERGFAL